MKEISLLEVLLRTAARVAAASGVVALVVWLTWVMLDVKSMQTGFTLPNRFTYPQAVVPSSLVVPHPRARGFPQCGLTQELRQQATAADGALAQPVVASCAPVLVMGDPQPADPCG